MSLKSEILPLATTTVCLYLYTKQGCTVLSFKPRCML